MTDPVFQDNQQNQDNQISKNDKIFGGSDDIFENEDMFEPVQKNSKTSENTQESTDIIQENTVEEDVTAVQNLDISTTEQNKVEQLQETENTETAENSSDENFDNIFGGEEDEEESINKETTNEPINMLEPLDEITEDNFEEENINPEITTNTESENTLEMLEDIEPENTDEETTKNSGEENSREEVIPAEEEISETSMDSGVNQEGQEIEEENIKIPVAPIHVETEDTPKEEKENKNIDQTELQQGFYDLLFSIKDIYTLKNLEDGDNFDLDQGNTKYTLNLGFNEITIIKTLENMSNKLKFQMESKPKNLVVFVNEEKLYREDKELKENEKNKIKVQEKFKKFLVLANEEVKKLEQQQKDEQLNGVFRDF